DRSHRHPDRGRRHRAARTPPPPAPRQPALGRAGLAGRRPVLLPGALDGDHRAARGVRRRQLPADGLRAPDAHPVPRDLRPGPAAVPDQLGVRERLLGPAHRAARGAGGVRAVAQARREVAGRAVLLHLHQDAAGGRGHRADLPDRQRARHARQHLDPRRALHRDEPAAGDLGHALVLPRGPGRAAGGLRPGRRLAAGPAAAHRRADRLPRHRRDRADLLHLQLERVPLRTQPDLDHGRHRTGLPGRLRQRRGPVPGQALRGGHPGLPARPARRLGRPEQAGPRPVHGRHQV
ncbi:MAG: Various polyols ABC transporter, permease protein 2, partial [uncultured Corynebacteriales bacterium]